MVAFSHTATAENVVRVLETICSRHGNPESILSDNDPQYTSATFAAFLKDRDIHHDRISVYYPAANGAVERFHRGLRSCIQTAIQRSQPWTEAVTDWLQVYRATPHATTNVSPHELLYGYKMRTKLDILPIQPANTALDDAVRNTVQQKQAKMKRYTDSRRGARTPLFQEGEKVRVRIPHHVPKAHPRFSAPATVEKKIGKSTFLLSDGKKWNASHLAHVPAAADFETKNTSATQCPPALSPNRQPRARTKPSWHKDYVTK